ncbi:probable membrane protein YPO2362 [Brevundimonas diminuta 3F5N]|uniref:Probable membrane protein YPO2362 n=1 Tax=Brevundimonas diminuta 3F5N TaxID=1255603 RepID=A0A1R4F5U3_BREDI|nr:MULTISPECIES: Yip1 family protein [Brevundimonas]SJM51246.1 probable membrane protein YPO2362 [Brevundimonas diminuta 3F5N]
MTLENPPAVDPSLVSRAKYILTRPKFEWPVIDAESASIKGLFTSYAVILAAIPAVATIVGQIAFGHRGLVGPLLGGALSYVLSLVSVYVLGLIIDALAPTFGGTKNPVKAMQVAVYSMTAAWVAGVLNVLPMLAWLAGLLGLYGFYLMYLGLPTLMKTAADKALGYTIVVVVAAIILNAIVFAIVGAVIASFVIVGAGATAFALS